MMIFVPFMVMLLTSMIAMTNGTQSPETRIQSGQVSINDQSGQVTTSPINVSDILMITAVVGLAVGICVVMAIKVFGSGISGSVIPIVFIVTVLTSIFVLLSGMSFNVITSIPFGIGYAFYFGLMIMYVVGLTGLASTSGGD